MSSKQCPQCGNDNEVVVSRCSECGFEFYKKLESDRTARVTETLSNADDTGEWHTAHHAAFSDSSSPSGYDPRRTDYFDPRERYAQSRLTDWSTLLGFVGAAVLFIGVFTPILTLPILGSVNYFKNGIGDGVVVIALSLISVVLVLVRRSKVLFVTGGLSLAMFAFTYFSFQSRMSSVKSEMKKDLQGNPFSGIGEAFVGSVQLDWGWAILILGAVLLIVAAAMVDERRYSEFPGLLGSLSIWLSESKRLAFTIGAIAFLAIGLIGFNVFLGTDLYKRASNTASGFVPNLEDLKFRNSVSVDFLSKDFLAASPYSGQFADRILVSLEIRNTSEKQINVLQGKLKFSDVNGDVIKIMDFSLNEGLDAGASRIRNHYADHYAFTAHDEQFKTLTLEQLSFEFIPEFISFADGTKIERTNKLNSTP